MNDNRIRVAFIYKKSYNFFQPNFFHQTYIDFFFKALSRNNELEVTNFPCEVSFDVSKLKGKYDVILLPNNRTDGAPDELIGIKKLGMTVISRTGDPYDAKRYHQVEFIEKNKIDFVFSNHPDEYIYKYYPKKIKHKTIIYGLESQLYQNVKPFKDRIKDKILITGAMGRRDLRNRMINALINRGRSGWYHYKLRTLCRDLPYVAYNTMKGSKYINQDYVSYTSKYRAIISATTYFPTQKYLENPAAGCLTFMEITNKNHGEFLGFKDDETAVFITEKNYQSKLEEFISDPDNPKWEKIADAGKEYVMKNLTNDTAVNELVKLMRELIK